MRLVAVDEGARIGLRLEAGSRHIALPALRGKDYAASMPWTFADKHLVLRADGSELAALLVRAIHRLPQGDLAPDLVRQPPSVNASTAKSAGGPTSSASSPTATP